MILLRKAIDTMYVDYSITVLCDDLRCTRHPRDDMRRPMVEWEPLPAPAKDTAEPLELRMISEPTAPTEEKGETSRRTRRKGKEKAPRRESKRAERRIEKEIESEEEEVFFDASSQMPWVQD